MLRVIILVAWTSKTRCRLFSGTKRKYNRSDFRINMSVHWENPKIMSKNQSKDTDTLWISLPTPVVYVPRLYTLFFSCPLRFPSNSEITGFSLNNRNGISADSTLARTSQRLLSAEDRPMDFTLGTFVVSLGTAQGVIDFSNWIFRERQFAEFRYYI